MREFRRYDSAANVGPYFSQSYPANFIRPLFLLNIEALESVEVEGSFFDPSYSTKLEKAEFLGSLSKRITAPVMPDDEPFEYLPTQAIADFLATGSSPSLDGIVYPSVQGAGGMKNIVLFHEAALVQEMGFPEGTKLIAQTETTTADGPEFDYWVGEETPAKQEERSGEEGEDEDWQWPNSARPEEQVRKPSLRIVTKSIEVHHITGIAFETSDHPVRRHRSEKHIRKFQRQGLYIK